jgi:hypothetical protein
MTNESDNSMNTGVGARLRELRETLRLTQGVIHDHQATSKARQEARDTAVTLHTRIQQLGG